MKQIFRLVTISSPYGMVVFNEKGIKEEGLGLLGESYKDGQIYELPEMKDDWTRKM